MPLRIAQEASYDGNDWWSWSVRLVGEPAELAPIGSVVYHLHPTFPNPVVEVRNRRSGFRLKSGGWGSFVIRAHVKDGNGKVFARLRHLLALDYAPVDQKRGRERAKMTPDRSTVFISSSAADAEWGDSLRQRLEASGFRVRGSQDLGVGALFTTELAKLVEGVDGVVAILSSPPSRWVEAEVQEARRRGLRVVPLVLRGAEVPPSIRDLVTIELGPEPLVSGEIVKRIARAFGSAEGGS